jgi:hypothetical protein
VTLEALAHVSEEACVTDAGAPVTLREAIRRFAHDRTGTEGRFLIGPGVSHSEMVESMLERAYAEPVRSQPSSGRGLGDDFQ